ncbi:UDP-N-acetylmuramoyl-L-alanyl-D-glutamate--2,6-diaminopimelate ligase [Selenomonadales bacterium OttesenSCG-928-I06]|nr:UDP-N-acetylmuramoyl-L-alanyl-D-glutamate--2,6-diaminopimelate ligase [Selenomonadales bacterium OttesenSCG-928-I06]
MNHKLKDILSLLENYEVFGDTNIEICSITQDSRNVSNNTLFVCIKGYTVDGHNYISQAIKNGAKAILIEENIDDSLFIGVSFIKVFSTKKALEIIAPHFYDYPAKKLRMIGITGTNGKTTTSYLIRNILMAKGHKVGLMGTIENLIDNEKFETKNTTPEVIELQETLAKMVDKNIEYAVTEVSSHALKLNRIAGSEYDVAIFTNISRDHLDFHLTFDDYLESKALLFSSLTNENNVKKNKTAIINIDDPSIDTILKATKSKIITFSAKSDADIKAENIQINSLGTSFSLTTPLNKEPITLNLKITGLFNVYNVLAAIGATIAEGIDLDTIIKSLESFNSVDGRFELVNEGQNFAVIVDYAHTPDGMENVLKTALEFAEGRIIVVFGCGGDRDKTKRPLMGKMAVKYGDIILATSDNPRTEDPTAILQDIEVGIKEELNSGQDKMSKTYEIIPDRKSAIEKAVSIAQEKDIIMILGKGHETYQILKNETIHFDDREIARLYIQNKLK